MRWVEFLREKLNNNSERLFFTLSKEKTAPIGSLKFVITPR